LRSPPGQAGIEGEAMNVLPTWVLYTQALALPGLALVGALIAFFQFRTVHNKLRLDLLERRLELYQTLVLLLGKALTHGTAAGDKEVQNLYRLMPTVGFLFDDSVLKFTEEIAEAEMKRRWAEKRLESSKSNRDKNADDSQQAFDQMRELSKKLKPVFSPYLSFGNIKTNLFW
jgi:hypothetical protein